MKKALLIILSVIGFAAVASAQPKSIGVRIGDSVDISYEHIVSGSDFIEVAAGLEGYNAYSYHADAAYDLMIARPDWTDGSWGFYAGPGVGVALWGENRADTNVYAGLFAKLGLEYIFDDIPLQLSIDARPRLMFGQGGIWTHNLVAFGLGIRYAF